MGEAPIRNRVMSADELGSGLRSISDVKQGRRRDMVRKVQIKYVSAVTRGFSAALRMLLNQYPGIDTAWLPLAIPGALHLEWSLP